MTKTTLILLPGLDGTDIFYQPLLAALPDSVQPLVISYPASGNNSYAALLQLVRQTVADVPACHVLGWSFSGPLALMLAVAELHKVRGVILAATFVRLPNRLLSNLRFALAGPTVWSWRAVRRLPLLLRPSTDPLRRAKMQSWKRVNARVLAARLRAILGVDVREPLCQCRQPMLYLASQRDDIVPRRNADEMLALQPSVRVVTIPGRHQAMYTHPEAAAQAIAEFIDQASTSASPG